MTSAGWSFVAVAAQLLESREREVVLGDLMETRESAWRGFLDVLGLAVRRQLLLWKSWRLGDHGSRRLGWRFRAACS